MKQIDERLRSEYPQLALKSSGWPTLSSITLTT